MRPKLDKLGVTGSSPVSPIPEGAWLRAVVSRPASRLGVVRTVRGPFLGQTCAAPVDVGGRWWTGFQRRAGQACAFCRGLAGGSATPTGRVGQTASARVQPLPQGPADREVIEGRVAVLSVGRPLRAAIARSCMRERPVANHRDRARLLRRCRRSRAHGGGELDAVIIPRASVVDRERPMRHWADVRRRPSATT